MQWIKNKKSNFKHSIFQGEFRIKFTFEFPEDNETEWGQTFQTGFHAV